MKDLEVRSPIKGTVLTWKLDERLEHRPVGQGQTLMQVADLKGPWQLELQMPEDRMGHITRRQQELYDELRGRLRKALREKLGEVPVEQLEGEVAKVADRQLTAKLRELLGEELGEGNIIVVEGIAGHPIVPQQAEGLAAALADYPGINVVATVNGDWTPTTTKSVVTQTLATNPADIDGVWTSGSETVLVTEAFSAGYDGVIMIGCKFGDDYQCHFIKGSELAEYRRSNIGETLEKMSMENERVQLHQLEISEYQRVPEIFDGLMEVIDQFGMNPFKGM